MPAYQRLFAEVTDKFSIGNKVSTQDLLQEGLSTRQLATVEDVLNALDIELNDDERTVLAALPLGIQSALLGLVHGNFTRGNDSYQIQFVWEPSYEYKLTIHEAFATHVSQGGITVILGTRYPGDPAPGTLG